MQDIEQQLSHIYNDREHGSRWLLREAITFVRDLAQMQEPQLQREQQMQLLEKSIRTLANARPAMGALSSAMGRIYSVYGDGPLALAQTATQLLQEYTDAPLHIAEHAQPLLFGSVLTCSLSSTVLDVLIHLRSQLQRVIVLEGRPRYEGRTMAAELAQQGISVTLITDAQADIFLPHCDCVVVGADSVLVNGDVLNKAGTALLAWSAHGHAVPFYVLCETLKISPRRWVEHDLTAQAENNAMLEEKEPEEVLEKPIAGVSVRNFYFDRTPYRLIRTVVTESGILDRRAIREIAVATRAQQRNLNKNGKNFIH